MGVRYQTQPRSALCITSSLYCPVLFVLLMILFSTGRVHAQKSPACNGCPALNAPAITLPRFPDDRVTSGQDITNKHPEQSECSIEPFPGLASIATVESLKIPSKARKEYSAACLSLKSNKLAGSEQHLRRALQIYPKYAAGWVMLGQILEARQQSALARDACLQATDADPKYVASYLCLAEIAGREEKWAEVLRRTARALELDAAPDPYAYFFSAIAYFNLNQFPEAEQHALKAEELDSEHREPRVQFLLGQIYKAKNDPAKAAAQLREFLKYAPTAPDSEAVKEDLARLEAAN